MKKVFFTLLLGACISISSAQYWEAGVFVGTSSYKGDLRVDYFTPHNYHLAIGLLGKYRINRHWATQVAFTRGQISGNDLNSPRLEERARNLSFRSHLYEVNVQMQYFLTKYDVRDDKISSPYIFAGIAGFHFNPQASYHGRWYNLQPLGTEGQVMNDGSSNDRYRLLQVSVPFGLGWQIALGEVGNIGIELGVRKTFTDYLDDVSGIYPDVELLAATNPEAATLAFRSPEFYQNSMDNPVGTLRGNPDTKDWYFMLGVTYTVNLADKYQMEFDERYKLFGPAVED